MNDATLRELGIHASWQQLKSIDPRSKIEPPCVLQSTLAANNLFNIGAFTGVFGGRLGHSNIGRYCSISYNVDIASDQHPTDWLSTSMLQYCPDVHGWESWLENCQGVKKIARKHQAFTSNKPVQIGNDVWIGQGAFVKSGVTIGDGAIIAAHAVVVKDVNPYEIVAGVPARTIRRRFSDAICEKLLALEWWQYGITTIPEIDFSRIESAIDTIQRAVDSGRLTPYQPSVISIHNL